MAQIYEMWSAKRKIEEETAKCGKKLMKEIKWRKKDVRRSVVINSKKGKINLKKKKEKIIRADTKRKIKGEINKNIKRNLRKNTTTNSC